MFDELLHLRKREAGAPIVRECASIRPATGFLLVRGEYVVTVTPSARADVAQTWASAEVSIDRAAPGAPAPEIGIFFNAAELAPLRDKIRVSPFRDLFAALVKQAEGLLNETPEADIGHLVPKPDRRWCRTRDMARKSTAESMEMLAFAGLVGNRPEMSRMAARMAPSI